MLLTLKTSICWFADFLQSPRVENVFPTLSRCCPSWRCQLPQVQILCKDKMLVLASKVISYDLFQQNNILKWPHFGLNRCHSFLSGQCCARQKVQWQRSWGQGGYNNNNDNKDNDNDNNNNNEKNGLTDFPWTFF